MSETATQTAEERIAELETELADAGVENKELAKENLDLAIQMEKKDGEITTLKQEVDDLQDEVNTLDDRGIKTALELYADPANWDGDRRFVPVMKHIDADDPYWPARQALKAAGI